MKTTISMTTAFVLFVSFADAAGTITEQKIWSETYNVDSTMPYLDVSNIWGSIEVTVGEPGQIVVSAAELRSAPTRDLFERSLEVLPLYVDVDNGGVSIVVGNRDDRWKIDDNCDDCRLDVQFEIVVPPTTALNVGTVMDGRVKVDGILGPVSASNVNGPVSANDIGNCESIESVNGSVDISFVKNPDQNCDIETVNGDITLDVPENVSMDVTFDLFNGEFSSELNVGPLDTSATIEHVSENGHNRYRIQRLAGLRLGAGGPTYSISSINGDVRILKSK